MDREIQEMIEEVGRNQLRDPDVTSKTHHVEIEGEDMHVVVHVTRNKREAICAYESAIAVGRCWPSTERKVT
jgi:hypothetical protein